MRGSFIELAQVLVMRTVGARGLVRVADHVRDAGLQAGYMALKMLEVLRILDDLKKRGDDVANSATAERVSTLLECLDLDTRDQTRFAVLGEHGVKHAVSLEIAD